MGRFRNDEAKPEGCEDAEIDAENFTAYPQNGSGFRESYPQNTSHHTDRILGKLAGVSHAPEQQRSVVDGALIIEHAPAALWFVFAPHEPLLRFLILFRLMVLFC